MRALLLDRLPNVATATKEDAERPLNGVKVNDAALVQALLNHGTYDTYYYVREAAGNRKAESYAHSERLQALDLASLELLRLEAPDELVLFTSSHHLAKFVPFRQFCGHTEWPICGLSHGLSSNNLIPSYSWNYFASIETCDAIICTSQAGKRALSNIFDGLAHSRSVRGGRGFYPPRMPVIPLGIDLSNTKNSWHTPKKPASEGFVVLCLGRFTPSHKADLRPLIAAFLRRNELPANSTLILAGDDTQSHIASSLQEFALSFPGTRKVVVMPDVSDQVKSALLHTADVALCMSDTYQETFGLSVLEAMAAGLPVVAPYWDGYQDLVVHERTGFLARTFVCRDTGFLSAASMLIDPAFPLGQRVIIDIEGMVYYLSLLGKHRCRAAQMGERARDHAKTFYSWEAIIPKYEALWSELLRQGVQPRPSDVGEAIGFIDYDRAFGEYPGGMLPPDTAVSVQTEVDDFLALRNSGNMFSPSPVAGFSESLDDRILEICRSQPELTLEELIAQVADPATGQSMVITQISRLAKYGILAVFPRIESETTGKESDDEVDTGCALRPVGV